MIPWFLALPFKLLLSLLRLLSAAKRERAPGADGAAVKYIKDIEQRHGASHLPLFAQSYRKAVEKAKADLRFLMVILTSEVHEETEKMQALLCEETLRSYILDNDILVWAGNVAELEAYRVSQSLGVSRYPFVGLIVYNTLRSSTMSCVSKIEGTPDAMELLTHLQESIDRYGPTLISLKADRREHSYAREIRAEQDSAYETSLRKDREKAETRRREEEARELLEKEQEIKATHLDLWKQWKHNTMIPEPQESRNVSRISFRMPDGSRSIRKFAASVVTVDDIYAWVELQLHPLDQIDVNVRECPQGYVHKYDFTLAVPMPRKILDPDGTAVSQTKEIFPSGSLIVEMLE